MRRAFGPVAATVAGGLLAVNEMQVWQAKFPTAEAMSQFLYAGALLAVVVALRTRWRLAAALGGAFVGMGFVARPEGILVVGLAAVALALRVGRPSAAGGPAPSRTGDPWTLFALGLLPTLLIGTYQAYGTGLPLRRAPGGPARASPSPPRWPDCWWSARSCCGCC